MRLFGVVDDTVDRNDRAEWLSPPFDGAFAGDEPPVPPTPPPLVPNLFKLYDLLPTVIKSVDAQSAQVVDGSSEPLLQRFFDALQLEYDVQVQEISDFRELVNVGAVPINLLGLLSVLLGERVPNTLSESRKRLFVGSLVTLYKTRGQFLNIQAVLRLSGADPSLFRELYKSKLYEEFDYSETQDYDHPYRAARFELVGTQLKTVVSDENMRDFVLRSLPINVLEKPLNGVVIELEDTLPVATELFVDDQILATGKVVEYATLNDGEVYFADQQTCQSVGLEIVIGDVCQHSCQSFCEYGACETAGCQVFCETHCQTNCVVSCQLACQHSCENACMSHIQ